MKPKKKILIFIFLFFPNSAFSDISKKEFLACSLLKEDIKKIECFDNLGKKFDLNNDHSISDKEEDFGEWNISTETNPLDDTKTITTYIFSESLISKPITLFIRCKSSKTELYINWRDYLGSEAYVTSRIGNNKAETRRWSLSTDSTATFFPAIDIELIKRLLEVDTYVAQVTPYSENPITAVFEINGIKNAIKPIRKECGW